MPVWSHDIRGRAVFTLNAIYQFTLLVLVLFILWVYELLMDGVAGLDASTDIELFKGVLELFRKLWYIGYVDSCAILVAPV